MRESVRESVGESVGESVSESVRESVRDLFCSDSDFFDLRSSVSLVNLIGTFV